MKRQVLPVGKRVRITKPGSFQGWYGTIQSVSIVHNEGRNPMCWYLVRLHIREKSVWFTHSEVELLNAAPFAAQAAWS
jgi:hypothetical protein